ncbi:MAG: MFS transporter [Deltaproteobacteria bacterium]|nr:MAG: MFS transporter [Deltaproteobacteria bacterium]
MAAYWQGVFHVGRGAIGNILFFVLSAVGLFMFFVGRWQERFGIRRMMLVGTLICGLSLLIVAGTSSLVMLYLWAFLVGVSSCFIYIPALTIVQSWYPERRGLVTGIVNFVFAAAAAGMAPLFNRMFQFMGYRPMNYLLVGLVLVTGLIAVGLTGMPNGKIESGEDAKTPVSSERGLTVGQAVRTKSFWFLWGVWALQGASGISMVTLSIPFGRSKGMAVGVAVGILTAFNLTSGISRIVIGYLSDRVGRNILMSLTFFIAAISFFILPHVAATGMIMLLAALIGVAFGTQFAVSAPLVTDCFGLAHFGAIFGLVFTAYGFLSGLIGPSLSGYLLDLTHGNFVVVYTYLGVFCLISSGLILGVRKVA